MKPYILDTSAIIALIKNQTGADIVRANLKGSIMSSVNYFEAAAVLARKMPRDTIASILSKLIAEIIDFDQSQAIESGILYQQTKEFGLSFSDLACLTLAKIKDLPVLTSDKIWLDLNLDLEIKTIR
jgi:PIN domain nuclease of toxin-antitoxin system